MTNPEIVTDLSKFEKRHPGITEDKNEYSNTAILAAIHKGYQPELIEKMMDLQERHEKNEARKAYHEAMSLFKENPPEIEKDKKVDYKAGGGTVSYSHASLSNITSKINAALGKFGLSASWVTKQENGAITVTCKIDHKLGHSESTALTASPDTSGSKNPLQAIGSTISYLQRYTILALTGLATSDMDDDGKAAFNFDPIDDEQKKKLKDMLLYTKSDEKKFLELYNAETIDNFPKNYFKAAMSTLKLKAKQNGNT